VYLFDGTGAVRKVANGVIQRIAGSARAGFGGDGGPAINASFYDANGLAVDGAGSIYIADTSNRRIRY